MLLISSSDRHLSFVMKGCCNYLNGYELRSMGMLELLLMLPKPNISLLYWFSQISNGAEKSIHLNLLICDCWMYIHLPLCLHARDNISKKTDNIVSLVQKVQFYSSSCLSSCFPHRFMIIRYCTNPEILWKICDFTVGICIAQFMTPENNHSPRYVIIPPVPRTTHTAVLPVSLCWSIH